MRIPPSVIVMSLVTAVPFALAVHDTMKPHTKTLDEMTEEERDAHFEQEMRQEAAEQAQRDAAETAKRAAEYKTFFGEKPAQLGSYFGSIHFGMPVDDPSLDALSSKVDPPYARADGARNVDTIRVTDDEHCDQLRSALQAAWQESADDVYLDTASHQRASFRECTVTFERYLDVNQWFDRKGAPVSMSLIGMPVETLRTALADKIFSDDGQIVMWTEPGIGRGQGPTHLTATIERDKVVGVSINVVTDPPTADAVHARLDGLIGKGVPDPEDPDLLVWKGKATLTTSDTTLSIELGK